MMIVPSSRPRVTGKAEFEKVVPRMKSLAMDLPPRRAIVEVNLVGERRMADLNRKYRGGRGAAEILTFSYVSDANDPVGEERVAGEIYLCWKALSAGARRRKVSRQVYALRLLAHGLCHLKGIGHADPGSERRMEEVEQRLLKGHCAEKELERLFA
jgi:rRNA maturation RNase YbeY